MLIFQHTALTLNKSECFVHFVFSFHRCCCNVLGSQNEHPSTETYISLTLFVLGVIYNKPHYRCIVRFKLYRGPSACRNACGEPYGSFFFQRTVPPLIYIYGQDCIKILQNTFFSQGRKSYGSECHEGSVNDDNFHFWVHNSFKELILVCSFPLHLHKIRRWGKMSVEREKIKADLFFFKGAELLCSDPHL